MITKIEQEMIDEIRRQEEDDFYAPLLFLVLNRLLYKKMYIHPRDIKNKITEAYEDLQAREEDTFPLQQRMKNASISTKEDKQTL